jgi:hypothetical protein
MSEGVLVINTLLIPRSFVARYYVIRYVQFWSRSILDASHLMRRAV